MREHKKQLQQQMNERFFQIILDTVIAIILTPLAVLT